MINDAQKLCGKPASVLAVFDYIKEHPIIDITSTAKALELPYNTLSSSVKILTELKILAPISNKTRNRSFQYTEYLKILKTGT